MPATRTLGILPLLEADPWFAGLPAPCRGWFAAAARRRTLADGQRAYRVGDPPTGLFRVLSGVVRLVSYPSSGRPLVNLAVPAGRWFGVLSTLDGGRQPHDAIAIGRISVLHIPAADVQALLGVTPDLLHPLAQLACQQQRAAIDHVGKVLLHSPPARLAHMLLDLTEGGDGIRQVRTSLDDLAGRMGVSRRDLGRLLANAEQSGLIRRSPGLIEILDAQGLAALVR